MIEIKTGLSLPIKGSPKQEIGEANAVTSVAIVGSDYPGMKPTMLVQEGDQVKLGQPLFADKRTRAFYLRPLDLASSRRLTAESVESSNPL